MDEEIRALASLHGYDDLTDKQVAVLRHKIAAAHVDGFLDKPVPRVDESLDKAGPPDTKSE